MRRQMVIKYCALPNSICLDGLSSCLAYPARLSIPSRILFPFHRHFPHIPAISPVLCSALFGICIQPQPMVFPFFQPLHSFIIGIQKSCIYDAEEQGVISDALKSFTQHIGAAPSPFGRGVDSALFLKEASC